MGASLIVTGIVAAISVASAVYGFLATPKQQTDQLKANSAEDFNVTQAKEGTVVPMIYGKVRTEANIVWWGNLTTEEIQAESPAGKGMGESEGGTSGFSYYADVWQVICQVFGGYMVIGDTYVNDSLQDLVTTSETFNDGTESDYPTEPGEFAGKLPGISHIFLKGWYLGDNVNTMPSVQWIMERVLPDTLDHANLDNGNNPAAIVLDLLLAGGVPLSKIDLDAFQAAADYWHSKGRGLNLKFNSQEKVSDLVEKVMSYVDGTVFEDANGKYSIRAFDPSDSTDASLSDDDYLDFSINVPSWDSVNNDFRGTYNDELQDFTKRVVSVQNAAAIEAIGYKKTQTVDLSGYRDADAAAQMIYEIMKRESFPAKRLTLRLHLKWSSLLPGDVISITHSVYGISSAEFRINSISMPEIDNNEVQVEAEQMTETLFDDTYTAASGPLFELQEFAPVELDHVAVFELPYNSFSKFDTALLLLAARKNLTETGFDVWTSASEDGEYRKQGTFTSFSQYGTLAEDYSDSTYEIDDEVGILLTPYKEDPEFASLTRQDLFLQQRFAVVGSEIIAFQNIDAEGDDIRLTGCIRGVLNTPVAEHSSGADIWLVNFADNILVGSFPDTVFVQFSPRFQNAFVELPVTKNEISITNKCLYPYKPSRVVATRSGSDVTVEIWPATPGLAGAGVESADSATDAYPLEYRGSLEIDYETGTESLTPPTNETSFSKAGAFTLSVQSQLNGYLSDAYVVEVGSGDGEYI